LAARGTGEHETLDAELALLAVGYQGMPIEGVTLDAKSGLLSNVGGRIGTVDALDPQCYVVGWLKRGPQGVIGTNKGDARATVATMLDNLSPRQAPAPDIEELLVQRQVNYVNFSDWNVLDALERERGGRVGKPREKFVAIADALASLKQHAQKLES
jgi:ferredoxin--NADP+ reductase